MAVGVPRAGDPPTPQPFLCFQRVYPIRAQPPCKEPVSVASLSPSPPGALSPPCRAPVSPSSSNVPVCTRRQRLTHPGQQVRDFLRCFGCAPAPLGTLLGTPRVPAWVHSPHGTPRAVGVSQHPRPHRHHVPMVPGCFVTPNPPRLLQMLTPLGRSRRSPVLTSGCVPGCAHGVGVAPGVAARPRTSWSLRSARRGSSGPRS